MNKKIKMVWQFSGMDALKTADHHLIHLNEYIQREGIDVIDRGTVLVNDFSAISFVIVDNSFVQKLRIDLKPHKGFLVEYE